MSLAHEPKPLTHERKPLTTSLPAWASARLFPLVLLVSMWATSLSLAADEHKPSHGGVFVHGRAADYELVVEATSMRLYVTDHGQPKDLSNASARINLVSDGKRREVTLRPVGDYLEATGDFTLAPKSQAVATLMEGDKPTGTVRFALD